MPREWAQSNNKKCPENGVNNGVIRVETAVNNAKDIVALTIKTSGSETDDVTMDVYRVVYSDIPRKSKFYSFQ